MDDSEAWYGALGSLPEVLRPADLPKLNEGLRYLLNELREARTVFIRGSHLEGVYLSFVAVNAFVSLFRAMGAESLMVPLMALESALWVLDEGVTEPLLKPARAKARRPRASQLRQEFQGMVAYTVHRLHDFGYSLAEVPSQIGVQIGLPLGPYGIGASECPKTLDGISLLRNVTPRCWQTLGGRPSIGCHPRRQPASYVTTWFVQRCHLV